MEPRAVPGGKPARLARRPAPGYTLRQRRMLGSGGDGALEHTGSGRRPAGRLTLDARLERAVAFTNDCLARFAYVTRNDLRVRAVRDAVVTARAYGPDRSYTGAVYDGEDALVPESLRFNQGDINPADPPHLPAGERIAADPARRPLGIYAGPLFPILGHFLFEALARLWPLAYLDAPADAAEPIDVVVHDWPGLDIKGFFGNPLYAAVLGAIGVTPGRIVLADRALCYDTLLVADPASRYHIDMNAEMGRLLRLLRARLLGAAAPPPPASGDRLFLSRSRWGSNRRVANEAAVDAGMEARGFRVVFPEALAPAELMAVLAGASMVVSFDGSHAHLAAFCEPDTACVLFDTRPVPTQIAIARLCGFRIMHVPLFDMPDLFSVERGVHDVSGLCALAERAIRECLVYA